MPACAKTNEIFLENIITGDEIWAHYYDPGTKQQTSLDKSSSLPQIKK
jgi:hypothetical protein